MVKVQAGQVIEGHYGSAMVQHDNGNYNHTWQNR